jgi:hypothetical protein
VGGLGNISEHSGGGLFIGAFGQFFGFYPEVASFLPDILLALSSIAFMQCHCDNAVVVGD